MFLYILRANIVSLFEFVVSTTNNDQHLQLELRRNDLNSPNIDYCGGKLAFQEKKVKLNCHQLRFSD